MFTIYPHLNSSAYMNEKILEIGVAAFNGPAADQDLTAVAQQVVTNALAQVAGAPLPIRCALLFATADWCRTFGSELPKSLRDSLQEALHYPVPLLGGSSAEIFCTSHPDLFLKEGLVLILNATNDERVTIQALPRPHGESIAKRRTRVQQLATDLRREAGVKLGPSTKRYLLGFLPGVLTDENGAAAFYDFELYDEILAAFDYKYRLFGASMADQLVPTTGYQFANDECLESGLVLALAETDIWMGSHLANGFTRQPDIHLSVDELADVDSHGKGYVITRLDGKPVVERLQELTDAGLIPLDRPAFGLPHGDDFDIYWPLTATAETKEALRLKRKVKLGDQLYLLNTTPKQMLKTAGEAFTDIFERASSDDREPKLLFCFSCCGRIRTHKEQSEQQALLRERLWQLKERTQNVPIIGILTAGEYGMDRFQAARADNMSLFMFCQANAYSSRAHIRVLHARLVKAASNLLNCATPRAVMEQVLKDAAQAGATGGKFSIVDYSLGHILGKTFGVAFRPPGSPQNWEAVAKYTDRSIPATQGGDFPLQLRDMAMDVVPGLSAQLNYTPTCTHTETGQWDDILTLSVRTLQAVFIPDCRELKGTGLIDEDSRAEGNIVSQLVIPLMKSGESPKVLAILQLSFPENKPLDHERLALWVSYAQKVAAAIERAQEAEQNNLLQKISALGKRILQSPLSPKLSELAHGWCQEYLEEVVKLLGADGGHIRTLRLSHRDTGDEFLLRAAKGPSANLLRSTRRVLRESEGTFRSNLLKRSGTFLNTRKEVEEADVGVKALENAKRYREVFTDALAKVNAAAFFPLTDKSVLIGSCVFDSHDEYFFTESRRQLALAAAEMAGSILQARRSDYFRVNLTQGLEELENLNLGQDGTAQERLQRMLERLCATVGADVASIFAWYKVPGKLALHTGHNWYTPRVGEATYAKGDGWTGNLLRSKESLHILFPDQPETQTESYSGKYYDDMIPPKHRCREQRIEKEPRIGIKLMAGANPIGVMTLIYYRDNKEALTRNRDLIEPFIMGAASIITLGLEAAQREAREERTKRFFALKDKVVHLLYHNPPNWQESLDAIRDVFAVEHVSFYPWRDGMLEVGWRSTTHLGTNVRPDAPTLNEGLKNALLKAEEILLENKEDDRLASWPDSHRIKNLYALPASYSSGELQGLLEFVNLQKTPNRPFKLFDKQERDMARDITRSFAAASERVAREEELVSLTNQLATATKIGARSLFSAIVMHQVLSPFSIIRSTIDWLQLHPDSPREERDRQLRRIETLYEQAVEILQEAARRETMGVRRENLRTIVREALRFIEPERPPGVTIKETNELRVEVYVDLWAIVGALINLLSNALDATGRKGVLTIVTELSPNQQAALIRIHNTGFSPTEADIARFRQAGFSTKKSDENLGLGLPLAIQAIEGAGGTLQMAPVREGVEVIVSLPLAQERGGNT